MKNTLFLTLIVTILTAFLLPVVFVDAQYDLTEACESSEMLDNYESFLSQEEFQALLEQCQTYFEGKRATVEQGLEQTEEEKETLENQIYMLNRRIKDLDYQIYQSNISIKTLTYQIGDTEEGIEQKSGEIIDQKDKIALILNASYQEGEKSILEIFLTSGTISEFFDNIVYFENLNTKNQELLAEYQGLKQDLSDQKEQLEIEKGEKESLVEIQELQMKESSETKEQTEYLHTLTEQEYQEKLAQKEDIDKKSAEIEARLFKLAGMLPGQEVPSFGEALAVAQEVSATTGVRAAFVLAIISQESAIGRNVGQCYITDFETGKGYKNGVGPWPRVSKPDRDIPIFLEITEKLGFNPEETPVSCYIAASGCAAGYSPPYYRANATINADGDAVCPKGYVPYGWGGAMGFAQFIPSTWKAIESRVADATGHAVPNPWVLEDAFTASAIYLKDLGAGTQSGEYTAAARYYGSDGSYPKQVASRAWCIQQYMDNGTMSSDCESLIF